MIMDGGELPNFVPAILSLARKYPLSDILNEVHFLANVDKPVRELRENKTEGEKLREIEASAKCYAKNKCKIPMGRGERKCMIT